MILPEEPTHPSRLFSYAPQNIFQIWLDKLNKLNYNRGYKATEFMGKPMNSQKNKAKTRQSNRKEKI